jgi:N-methylhydantoinase A
VRKLRVAVDIGGTFTDLVAHDEDTREQFAVKSPSTPSDFIDGVMNALGKAEIEPQEVVSFKHGSTIATNAIIERRGARTGLVTTKGFRDVLAAGRANRPDLFNSNWDPSPPLVPRRHVLEATERIDYEGNILVPLDEGDVRVAARKIRARGLESIAVSYLNSFMNQSHELRTKEILLEELDGVDVCTSSEILPEIREFERTSTVAANAYLMPVIDGYLNRLLERLSAWGYAGQVFVTHSGGGVISLNAARTVPARICHSGPAGGVIGGLRIGKLAGFENVITFDMGGTSTDLSLVEKGVPTIASEWRVDWNIPILFPAVDLVAIGAGGGTVAWVDVGGSLRVGPRSAGADPGPACYDKGNSEPTITDAQVYLGRIDPERFLGGEFKLRPERATAAIEGLAAKLGLSAPETASGIIRIADASMTSATHLISVERGYDPREFALVCGGGAGGLHAVAIADELGIPHVIVPPKPGVTSALGIMHGDLRHDFQRPVLQQTQDLDAASLSAQLVELQAQAREVLDGESIPPDRQVVELSLDVRYYGQTPYMNLRIDGSQMDAAAIERLELRFREQYQREFGYQLPPDMARIEVVNARAAAIGLVATVDPQSSAERGTGGVQMRDRRPVFFESNGEFTDTPIFDRDLLSPGARFSGPAVVEQSDTTLLIPPGASAQVDQHLNILIDTGVTDLRQPASTNHATTSEGA